MPAMSAAVDLLDAGADGHRAGGIAHGLGAVDHQVHHELLELPGVGFDQRQVVGQRQPHLHVLRNGCGDQRRDLAHLLASSSSAG